MKRLIVNWGDGYCNIPVTHIELREDSVVFAYNGDEFVGVFDLGAIAFLYVSEREATND